LKRPKNFGDSEELTPITDEEFEELLNAKPARELKKERKFRKGKRNF